MKISSFLLEDSEVSWGVGFHLYRIGTVLMAFARLCFLRSHGSGDDFFTGTNGTVLSRSDSTTFFMLAHCTSTLSSILVSLQLSSSAKAVSLAVFSL